MLFYTDQPIIGIADTELIKIKFEVDINPPKHASFEHQYRLLPAPYEVNLYDFVFYLARKTPVNLTHLRERLIQTGYITEEDNCSLEDVKMFLEERFESIDFEQAKADVMPFIRDHTSLHLWRADFFKQITNQLISV